MRITDDGLSRIFAALADPTRRDILTRLGKSPLTVGEIAEPYAMSRPAISQHLRVLEEAGLLTRTTRAQFRSCSLQPEGLDAARDWIAKHSTEWSRRFDLLEAHLNNDEDASTTTTPEGDSS